MLRNSLDPLWIEGAPLEARHGKYGRGVPGVLTSLQLGQRHRTQTGIAVKVELGLGAGLGVGQTGQLVGVSEQKRDWEARLVLTVDRQRVQVAICAQEHGPPVVCGVAHEHHAEVTRVWHVIADLLIEHDRGIVRLNVFNA
jgi:hypothetical protein